MPRIAAAALLVCLSLAACVTSGPITPEQVAEIRAREVDTAARLSVEGAALYQADTEKKTGYEYCSSALNLANRGEFRRAIREATKALFLGQQSGDAYLLAHANRDIALAYTLAGQFDRAETFIEQAVKDIGVSSDRNNSNRVKSQIYKIRGDIRLRQGRTEEALSDYLVALKEVAGETSRSGVQRIGLAEASLANAYLQSGDTRSAMEYFGRAREKLDEEFQRLIDRGLADVALREGRHEEARRLFAAAAEKYRSGDEAYHRVWALDGLARSEAAAGHPGRAMTAYKAAIDAVESVSGRFRSEEFKAGFFADVQDVFNRAIALAMQDGQIADAFELSERSRARALLDLLKDRFQSAGSRVYAEARSRAATLREVQSAIPDGTVVVAFHVMPEKTYLWLVRRSGVASAILPIGHTELAAQVSSYRKWVVQRSRQTPAAGVALHEALVVPMKLAAGERVVLVPHSVLHHLPFHSLAGQGGYLIEKHEVSYAPSASSLLVELRKDPSPSGRVLALGNPDLGLAKLNLPGAEEEARKLKDVYPAADIYLGKAASKAQLLASAPGNGLIHIAAHAEVDAVDPLYSVIHLARNEKGPEPLEAHEMYRVDLTNARIVTLSGCETGLGRISDGDEIWGFTRTFMSAGTRSLVVSLWQVADNSTADLMTRFYGDRGNGTTAGSLRRAQVALLGSEATSHPFFWAPFVLVGDWR